MKVYRLSLKLFLDTLTEEQAFFLGQVLESPALQADVLDAIHGRFKGLSRNELLAKNKATKDLFYTEEQS